MQPNPPQKEGEGDPETEAIDKVVNELWSKYDKDDSNALEKEEAFTYIKDVMAELNPSAVMSEDMLDQAFGSLDLDSNGSLSKAEFKTFVVKLTERMA